MTPSTKLLLLVTAALSVVACGSKQEGDACARGVDHAFALTVKQGTGTVGSPSADEQRAMDAVKQASLEQCRKEGLSQPQLDCILGATDWNAFTKLGECPAIKDKRPGWLMIP